MEQLINQIRQFSSLSDNTLNSLKLHLKKESIKKHSMLLKEGQTCNRLWFIKEGFVRVYYLHDGEDKTTWFLRENDFVISVYSFFSQQSSNEFIEVLEDSTLLSISFSSLQKMYSQHADFNAIGRLIMEHYYVLSEQRTLLLRTTSVEDRLNHLLDRIPDIFKKASAKQVASYIGCQPETLSRIRKYK